MRRFGGIVDATTQDVRLRTFIYAVLIYENFNRPPLYRWLERHVLFPLRRASSTGIMQVRAPEILSDEESVRIGARHLVELYEDALREAQANWARQTASSDPSAEAHTFSVVKPHLMQYAMFAAASKYNIRSDYSLEVHGVYTELLKAYHPELSDHSYGGHIDAHRTEPGHANSSTPDAAAIETTEKSDPG